VRQWLNMRFLILSPFLLVLVVFALSNAVPVRIGMWPTAWSVEIPLSLAILSAMGAAFLLGALFVWISELRLRHRARRAEALVQSLESELEEIKSRTPQTELSSLVP